MSSDKVLYGVVCWFNQKKGFGFIKPDNGSSDIFVHYTDILYDGFKALHKDQRVQFEIGKNLRGQDKAVNILILK